MPDLIFEIGTEELPSWYPRQATADLERMLTRALAQAGVSHGTIDTFSTPRRLALLVHDMADSAERRSEKRRGPPVAAAFDADGNHTRAASGFAASNGVPVDSLTVEDSGKGQYLYATVETGGERTAELLPAILTALVHDVPAPRKMRWGAVEQPFVRPVAWLLARLGTETIGFTACGVTSGGTTRGHRFLADTEIEITAAADYVRQLADAHVVADAAGRRQLTRTAVEELAATQDLTSHDDGELLDEVTGLVEYPFPILGSFDAAYLELPDGVLTTVLIVHQRFFPLHGADGRLARHFVGVSNNRVTDESVVRQGYEQVLGGRLYDARFFWDTDRQKSLAQHAWGLSGIGYQRELGSMADKVARVGTAAVAIGEEVGLDGTEMSALRTAVPLFRADLVTGMVNEFPELEGVMARAYAEAEGLPVDVATALEEGVLPKGPDSELPQTAPGTVLAVADKFEKLLGFVSIGRKPTGSADPFGLRRDGIGLARLLNSAGWQVSPADVAARVADAFGGESGSIGEEHIQDAVRFLWERVTSLLQEEGLQVRVIRAAVGNEAPVIDVSRRGHLLAALVSSDVFQELAALYKRAANIASEVAAGAQAHEEHLQVDEEKALFAALPGAAHGVSRLLELAREKLEPWDLGDGPQPGLAGAKAELSAALAEVLELKQPLDGFLDNVHVMVEDRAVRENRLALLATVRDSLRQLGALEELEGL